MLRYGGVGWGGVITFMSTCTPTSCYARVIFSCACTHTSCYAMVGWGGVITFMLTCTPTSCYARVIFSLNIDTKYSFPSDAPLCRKQDICASCKRLKLWCSCIWQLHFFKACHFCKHRLIIFRCLIFTFLHMKFDLLKDEICLHDEASWNYMGKCRKINVQMAAEHESYNPSNKKKMLWCTKRRGFLSAWSLWDTSKSSKSDHFNIESANLGSPISRTPHFFRVFRFSPPLNPCFTFCLVSKWRTNFHLTKAGAVVTSGNQSPRRDQCVWYPAFGGKIA